MTPTPPVIPAGHAPGHRSRGVPAPGHVAVDMIADHLEGIGDKPVFAPMAPAERAAILKRPLPDRGASPESLLALVGREILPTPWATGIRASSAG